MRCLFLSILHWIGFITLWRYFKRDTLCILYLHGVMDSDVDSTWEPLRFQTPRKNFQNTLKYLSKYYTFISLDEAVEMLDGNIPMRANCLVITFDDGYRNNIKHTQLTMSQYGVHPTIYVVTGHIDDRLPFWFDRLDYALQKVPQLYWQEEVAGRRFTFEAGSREGLTQSYKKLRKIVKSMQTDDLVFQKNMSGLALQLEEKSGESIMGVFEEDDWTALLTWDEAKQSKDISFGSHTVDHLRIPMVDLDIAIEQLTLSKKKIESMLDVDCDHFCYPNGCFSVETAQLVRQAGFKSAVTTVEGLNRVGDDMMVLKRIAFPESNNLPEVLAIVSGLSLAFSKVKRKIFPWKKVSKYKSSC